jgi:hypothetical protein
LQAVACPGFRGVVVLKAFGGIMNRLLAVFALAATAACSHVSFRDINPPPHALRARPPQSVEVFALGPPQRPFVEVGLVDADRSSWMAKEPLTALREAAGERGCDGIVLTGEQSQLVAAGRYVERLDSAKAVCIVWRDAEDAPVAANAAR